MPFFLRLGCSATAAGAALLLLVGCGSGTESDRASAAQSAGVAQSSQSASPFRGTVLGRPFDKPDQSLPSTLGREFNLRDDTAGKLVVLYVGFTNCPDVCPTTMADTAVALRRLPKAVRDDVQVVFVTADPNRDTVAHLRSWLGYFKAGFVGLTGSWSQVERVAHSVGIPIEAPVKNADGSWTVEHGAEILIFGTDGKAHEIFASGFLPAELTNDLKLLHEGKHPV